MKAYGYCMEEEDGSHRIVWTMAPLTSCFKSVEFVSNLTPTVLTFSSQDAARQSGVIFKDFSEFDEEEGELCE